MTTRNPYADPKKVAQMDRARSELVEPAARDRRTPGRINKLLRKHPRLAPLLLALSMLALVKRTYVQVSYKVFNIGAANLVPAYSGEIAIPTDGRHIEAVERIFEVAGAQRRDAKVYQTSPIALRFVKASPAYLSMMHGGETMMIELIELHGSKGAVELIDAYEEALTGLGGRPHWGQINTLRPGDVAAMYPRYADWQRIHRSMNATGVFDSPFSERVGIAADRCTS